jgi:hypothetical protein
MTMNLKEISRTSNVGIAGKWIFRVDTTNFSTCHNDYAMACESDPFCSCSTPDPQQKCMCTLKEDIQQCSYVPAMPTTGLGKVLQVLMIKWMSIILKK